MSLDVRLPLVARQLRLPTVAANYRKFAQEAARSGQPYEEYLLALLEQRPGAWEQAKPIREWQQRWPAIYWTA